MRTFGRFTLTKKFFQVFTAKHTPTTLGPYANDLAGVCEGAGVAFRRLDITRGPRDPKNFRYSFHRDFLSLEKHIVDIAHTISHVNRNLEIGEKIWRGL